MDEEHIIVSDTKNTQNLNNIFRLNYNSFNKYSSEFKVVSIKTIKESCKYLNSLLDKDTSTYKDDIKKIEEVESILINNIIKDEKSSEKDKLNK